MSTPASSSPQTPVITPGFIVNSEIMESNCCSPPVSYNVPSFIDESLYRPKNVDRREKRKKDKVIKLRNEIQLLKKQIKQKDILVNRFQSNVENVKYQKDNVIQRLEKKNKVLALDFITSEKLIEDMYDSLKNYERSEKEQESESDEQPRYFNFQTKNGKKYSPAIRKLYYSLLSAEVPPGKISNIVKTVLSSLFPSVDVSTLKLPGESCTGYMRREELKSASAAHQATILATTEKLHLNSDGTTKFQKKLNATAFNGVVLSVSEIPDGKAVICVR